EDANNTLNIPQVPPHRLLTLLQQAVAFQINNRKYHPKLSPKIDTLLFDYECFVVPNALKNMFVGGHKENIKCIEFLGEDGTFLASGSSDNTIKIWDSQNGKVLHTLTGHTSRIWDLSSTANGKFLASASGDSTVKIWNLEGTPKCIKTISDRDGDVYCVGFHQGQEHVIAGGYDKSVRLYDINTGALTRCFQGHTASVCSVIFNPYGSLAISGYF